MKNGAFMSSNQPPSGSNQNRLYTRLITTLKIIQYIGYFLVVVLFIGIFSSFGQITSFGIFNIVLLLYLFYALITCISIYITIEVLIAIIDLLSRIEQNTRPE